MARGLISIDLFNGAMYTLLMANIRQEEIPSSALYVVEGALNKYSKVRKKQMTKIVKEQKVINDVGSINQIENTMNRE